MDTSFLVGIVLVFLVLKSNKTVAVCQPKRKEFGLEFTNRALDTRLLGSAFATDEINCQFSCHANDFCEAYNFNTNINQCELLDGRSSYIKLETRQNWKFRAQKCDTAACANGGTCYHFNGKSQCVCPSGWEGDLCDVPMGPIVSVLSFPGGSTKDLALVEKPFHSTLNELTVSMKLQLDRKTNGKLTPVSYSTKHVTDNAICSRFSPFQTTVSILGQRSYFQDPDHVITDSNWHHILFTWKSQSGLLELYIDGVKRAEKSSVKTGRTMSQDGVLVLGQDQDFIKGGYNPAEALSGNLTSLNMWDRVLTAPEITDLASKCTTQEGNIVKWSQLVVLPRQGNVEMFQTSCFFL